MAGAPTAPGSGHRSSQAGGTAVELVNPAGHQLNKSTPRRARGCSSTGLAPVCGNQYPTTRAGRCDYPPNVIPPAVEYPTTRAGRCRGCSDGEPSTQEPLCLELVNEGDGVVFD